MRDRIVNTLSGGEQQRTHFARVMVQLACGEAQNGPGLLLLDEPTSSLDLRHQLDLLSSARRCVARGVAVVAVMHDLNLAAMFADRILIMKSGRVVRDGPPGQTITESNVSDVFGVTSAVGVTSTRIDSIFAASFCATDVARYELKRPAFRLIVFEEK